MVTPSVNGEDFLTTPPTQQRMVGMDECPLHVRSKWKSDSKFVLKRVGADPSWRARLGNLMIHEAAASGAGGSTSACSSRRDSGSLGAAAGTGGADDFAGAAAAAAGGDEVRRKSLEGGLDGSGESDRKDVDNFLVCVFNVSSKVSYSILQVPKTATCNDVITMALNKSRREENCRPEKFVLVEETDPVPSSMLSGPGSSSGGGGGGKKSKEKRKRVLDADENVYLVQLSWKGAGRLILEEKERLLRNGQLYHLDHLYANNPHLNLSEMHSEPLGGLGGKMSPRIRRSSKLIASGVRKISRSFYNSGGGGDRGHHHVAGDVSPRPAASRQRRMTTAAGGGFLTPEMGPSPTAASSRSLRLSPSLTRPRRNSTCGTHLSPAHGYAARAKTAPGVAVGVPPASASSEVVEPSKPVDEPENDRPASKPESEEEGAASAPPKTGAGGRRLSKVNLRKLKIW